MKLTDEIWNILEPAAKIGDKATREDIEVALEKGQYQLFQKNKSAAITAPIKNSLRVGFPVTITLFSHSHLILSPNPLCLIYQYN